MDHRRFALVSQTVRDRSGNYHSHKPERSNIDHEELWQPAWGVRTGNCGPLYTPNVLNFCVKLLSDCKAFFLLKAKPQLALDRLNILLQNGDV
jgi:hypothetical protein